MNKGNIHIFVSSTFSDLKLERDALQQRVFPKLEQLCLKDGFPFRASAPVTMRQRWESHIDSVVVAVGMPRRRRLQSTGMPVDGYRYGQN